MITWIRVDCIILQPYFQAFQCIVIVRINMINWYYCCFEDFRLVVVGSHSSAFPFDFSAIWLKKGNRAIHCIVKAFLP